MRFYLKSKFIDQEIILRAHVYGVDVRAIGLDCSDPETGEPVARLTTFIAAESPLLSDSQIILKNFGGNDGVVQGFVDAGMGHPIGTATDYVHFEVTNTELLALMKEARMSVTADRN